MKKIYIFILILLALACMSCSSEDVQTLVAEDNAVLTVDFTETVDFVSIRINDAEGHGIKSYQYQNVMDIRLDINTGEQLMIQVTDDGYFKYDYLFQTANNSVIFEGVQDGMHDDTLVKEYNL